MGRVQKTAVLYRIPGFTARYPPALDAAKESGKQRLFEEMGRVPKNCFSKRSEKRWLCVEPVRPMPRRFKWQEKPVLRKTDGLRQPVCI